MSPADTLAQLISENPFQQFDQEVPFVVPRPLPDGQTYQSAANKDFAMSKINIIVVTHQYGSRGPGRIVLTDENRDRMKKLGVPVVIGSDLLSTGHRAWRGKRGGTPFDIVADTLRMFCEGMKVCVEIAVMAADAGMIPVNEDVMTGDRISTLKRQ